MELRKALQVFLLVDRAQSTRETYEQVLERFAAEIGPGRPLGLIAPEDIDAYVLQLRAQDTKYTSHPTRPDEHARLSSATVYKHIKTIKRFFNWCIEREYLKQSPARYLTNKRPVRPLGEGKAATEDEVLRIIDAAKYKPRDLAVVLLLAQSGARASEIAGLKISNLNLMDHCAVVDGKGDKRRTIWFGPETSAAISAWLKHRPGDAGHDFVFTSNIGHGPLHPQGISQITRRLSAVCGLDRTLGAHAFRHYVGMRLARAGTPLTVIQHWLGHSNAEITLQYIRSIAPADLEAARKLLSREAEADERNEKLTSFFRRLG